MFSNIGVGGFLLIFTVVLILWGPKKLPELGRATGQTLRAFRESLNGKDEEKNDEVKKTTSKGE